MNNSLGRSLSRLGGSFLLFALVAGIGCSGDNKKNVITGKVTLNNQPVSG